MKKIFTLALLIALLCSGAFAESEITFADVAGANDGRLLITQYGSIGLNTIYYYEDEVEALSFFTYARADEDGDLMYVYEDSDGNVEIMKDGLGAGFYADTNELFAVGYVLGEYEFELEINLENLLPRPSEDSTSAKVTRTDDAIIFTEEFVYDGKEARIMEYTLDPETLFVREAIEYYRDSHGNVSKVSRAFTTVGNDYEISEQLEGILNPSQTRKVSVIVNAGDSETHTIEFAPPHDKTFMLMYPFEYIAYSDAEMKEFYEDISTGEDYPAETTIYLNRFE